MPGFSYLRRTRYGTFHYRRWLPPSVRPAFGGQSEVVRALLTHDRRDAILLAQEFNLQVETAIRAALGKQMPSHRIDYTHILKVEPDGSQTRTVEATPEDIKAWQEAGLSPEQIAALLVPRGSPQSSVEPTASKTGMTIAALGQRFRTELVGQRADTWTPPRNYATYQRRLVEMLGDQPIDTVSRDKARTVREMLQRLPANTACHRGKTIPEILASGTASDDTFSPKSVNSHLEYYERLFEWGINEGHRPGPNPFSDIRVKMDQRARDKRDIFTDQELVQIFSSKLYTAYGSDSNDRPYRYWMPLLLLATGARRAEIAGLYVSDIHQEPGTRIHYIDFNLDQPEKRLKTANAVRRTPIHPSILGLGFLKYVEKLRRQGERRLFPELATYSATDGYGRNFGEWFNNSYLADLGIYVKRRKTAHSFRHTFATLAQEQGIDINRIEELQGRQYTRQTVGQQVYIKATSIKLLSEDIKKLRFGAYTTHIAPFPV